MWTARRFHLHRFGAQREGARLQLAELPLVALQLRAQPRLRFRERPVRDHRVEVVGGVLQLRRGQRLLHRDQAVAHRTRLRHQHRQHPAFAQLEELDALQPLRLRPRRRHHAGVAGERMQHARGGRHQAVDLRRLLRAARNLLALLGQRRRAPARACPRSSGTRATVGMRPALVCGFSQISPLSSESAITARTVAEETSTSGRRAIAWLPTGSPLWM